MILYGWDVIGREPLDSNPLTATIGVFDGVHLGHQFLLKRLSDLAGPKGKKLVVTFHENPKKILNRSYPGDLMTWDEKLQALTSAGVDFVVVIDFSHGFSTISGRDFFNQLKKSFVFSQLVLGWDFSFGRGSATTAADLGWLANPETRLSILPPFKLAGEVVSSSAIRQAVLDGDFGRVKCFLGRPYEIPMRFSATDTGRVQTVGRSSIVKLLPRPGIYTVLIDEQETKLLVDENMVSWESPPGSHFQKIVFV